MCPPLLYRFTERLTLREQMLLPEEPVQRGRPDAISQRSVLVVPAGIRRFRFCE